MKKFFQTIFLAVIAAGTSFAQEQEQPASLYMIGTATAGGWSLDKATELTLVEGSESEYSWTGDLVKGTFKACAEKNLDAPFYRPETAESFVGEDGVTPNDKVVYTTSPDDQWTVTTAGKYTITIDTKALTIAAEYLGESEKKPIETETLYLLGVPNWDINNPTPLEKTSDYVFVWEGGLKENETFQACFAPGNWGAAFIVPVSNNSTISQTGVSDGEFEVSYDHANMWKVAEEGSYRITFNLSDYTVSAEYLGEYLPAELYMIGGATEGGWDWSNVSVLAPVKGEFGKYSYTGNLSVGEFKICSVKDESYSQPFYRPTSDNCNVSADGISAETMQYTAGDPDYKWNVLTAGNYTLTVDIKNMTIAAVYNGEPEKNPILVDALYLIGDVNGWNINGLVPCEKKSDYVFVYSGELPAGSLQATPVSNWNAPFIVPTTQDCKISKYAVENDEFDYSAVHTNVWKVEEAGSYTLTFDLEHWTLAVSGTSSTGIDRVIAEEEAATVYYNLQGIRVENPAQGVFLKRQGDKVSKVFIR